MLKSSYISQSFPEPVCLQMGKGEKEVIITIGKDGIHCPKTNTKETLCEKAKALIADCLLRGLLELLNTLSSKWSQLVSSVGQKLGVCSS